ncbi:hypothetical protein A3Q56_05766 [Intoshia linei]|uniref:protein-tyrosine-phosphatase n=1 Tax=Intoshia linei TaxID=1819745 RepID=A0A177AYN5_9BILA|nr:hypothetical protein A3Q56_05766 [Intoshia linei]
MWHLFLLVQLIQFKCFLGQDFNYLSHLPNVNVESGRSITLCCTIWPKRSVGEITFSWHLNNQFIHLSYHNDFTSCTKIANTAAHDSGKYRCSADIFYGQNMHTFTNYTILDIIQDLPSGFPVIMKEPQLKAVKVGDSIQFNCHYDAYPAATVEWLKDNLPLEKVERIKFLPNGNLKLHRSTQLDEGQYSCVVSNKYGATQSHGANLYIKVPRIPPHFVQLPPKVISILNGSAINLTCIVDGYPKPSLKWMKNDVILIPRDGVIIKESNDLMKKSTLLYNTIKCSSNFTCVAESEIGTIEASTFVYFKDLPVSPTNLSTLKIKSTSILLTWSDSSPRRNYFTEWKNKYNSSFMIVQKNLISQSTKKLLTSKKFIQIIGLEPFTTYSFQIFTINESGKSPTSSEITVTTAEDSPTDYPMKVQALGIRPNTIKVIWDNPDRINGKLEGFNVYYTDHKVLNILDWKVFHIQSAPAIISNCKANSTYSIAISALTIAGEGPTSPTVKVTCLPGIPGQPTNFTAEATNSSRIILRWLPPMNPDSITNYELYYTDETRSKEFTQFIPTKTKTYIIDNVYPNTEYSFKIASRSTLGLSPTAAIVSVLTPLYAPLLPAHIIKIQEDRNSTLVDNFVSIKISWIHNGHSIYSDFGFILRIEHVEGDPMNELFFKINNEETFTNSDSFMPNVYNQDLENSQFKIIWVKLNDLYKTNYFLNSNKFEQRFIKNVLISKIMNYDNVVIYLTKIKEGKGKFGEFIDSDKNFKLTTNEHVSLSQNDLQFTVNFDQLTKWTSYHILLTACNSKGLGPESNPTYIKTHEGVPGEPKFVSVLAINSTAFLIEWVPPDVEDRNGIMRGYNIFYRKKSVSSKHWRQLSVNDGMNTEFILNNLIPSTSYEIKVSAFTASGEGRKSEIYYGKTTHSLPDLLNNVIMQNTNNMVNVRWTNPSKDSGITGYRIIYNKIGHKNSIEQILPLETISFTTPILDFSSTYKFRIAAKSKLGFGKDVVHVIHIPDGVPTQPPSSLEIRSLSKNQYKITWQNLKMKFSNGKIQVYEVSCALSTIEYPKSAESVNLYSQMFVGFQEISQPPRIYNYDSSREKRFNTTDTYLILDLEKDRNFVIKVRAYTSTGPGPWSVAKKFKTLKNYHLLNLYNSDSQVENQPVVVIVPSNVQITRLRPTSLKVNWEMLVPNSNINGYEIFYKFVDLDAKMTDDKLNFLNVDENIWPSVIVDKSIYETELSSLIPYKKYVVAVRAILGKKNLPGPLSEIVLSDMSEQERLTMVSEFLSNAENPRSVILSWRPPKKIGFSRFKMTYMTKEKGRDSIHEHILHKNTRKMFIKNLKPNSLYTFNISALYNDTGWGPERHIAIKTADDDIEPMYSPIIMSYNKNATISIGFLDSQNLLPLPLYYILIVISDTLAASITPHDLDVNDLQTSDLNKTPRDVWIAAKFAKLPKTFVLGNGVYQPKDKYKNWPLSKNQKYKVFLRAYFDINEQISFISSNYSNLFKTNGKNVKLETKTIDPIVIVGPVCAVLLLVLIIVSLLIIRKKRRAKFNFLNSNQKMLLDSTGSKNVFDVEPPTKITDTKLNKKKCSININDFVMLFKRLGIEDNDKLIKEFLALDWPQDFSWKASSIPENALKNRYSNIIAYDHSRVKIGHHRFTNSDYINANYIDNYKSSNAYIATQAPLKETMNDFWAIVFENNVSCIVNLVQNVENKRCKAEMYWPEFGSEQYGYISVTKVDEIKLAIYSVITFEIRSCVNSGIGSEQSHQNDGYNSRKEMAQNTASLNRKNFAASAKRHVDKVKTVTLFHFKKWPNYGVPSCSTYLLSFMKRVRKMMTENPMSTTLVHCSGGVGRTGVYISIDICLDSIMNTSCVDIYGVVSRLRSQRIYSVQTEEQYIFVYKSILEFIEDGVTELSATRLYSKYQELTTANSSTDKAPIYYEYQALDDWNSKIIQLDDFAFSNVDIKESNCKNGVVIGPYEYNRVHFETINGIDESNFIDASYIDGYRGNGAYIACSNPHSGTVSKFWRMLWSNNSTFVVVLDSNSSTSNSLFDSKVFNSIDSFSSVYQYWPHDGKKIRHYFLMVEPLAEYNMIKYTMREFKLTDVRSGKSRTLRQFHYHEWPYGKNEPNRGEGFIDFICHVLKTKEKFGQDGPITIHCRTGSEKTGVFIALSIILERIRYEGVIDIYLCIKQLRIQRQLMVQSELLYLFCHRALLEYMGSFNDETNQL